MKRFVLMHIGFETPTQEIMDAWGHWFASLAGRKVENVGPFLKGVELAPDTVGIRSTNAWACPRTLDGSTPTALSSGDAMPSD